MEAHRWTEVSNAHLQRIEEERGGEGDNDGGEEEERKKKRPFEATLDRVMKESLVKNSKKCAKCYFESWDVRVARVTMMLILFRVCFFFASFIYLFIYFWFLHINIAVILKYTYMIIYFYMKKNNNEKNFLFNCVGMLQGKICNGHGMAVKRRSVWLQDSVRGEN